MNMNYSYKNKKKKKFPAASIILITMALCLFVYSFNAGYIPKDSAPAKIMTKISTGVSSKIAKFKSNNKKEASTSDTTSDNVVSNSSIVNSSGNNQTDSSSSDSDSTETKTVNNNVLNSTLRNVVYTYGLASVKTPEKYTHIILAFIYTDANGSLSNDFQDTASDIATFKKKHPTVKVLAAVTGTGAKAALTTAMQNSTARNTLATNLSNYVTKYNLDGIDLDWEYYNNYTTCNTAYRSLTETLRSKLGTSKIISMAGQSSENFYGSSDIVSLIKNTIDFISVMNYDYDTATAKENKVAYTGSFSQTKTVLEGYKAAVGQNYVNKINIGLPFYGLKFKVSSADTYKKGSAVTDFISKYRYNLIASEIDVTKTQYTDDNGVAYYNNGTTLYTFDDPITITTKINYASSNGFGGAMAWVASHDSNETLQNAVTKALNEASPSN